MTQSSASIRVPQWVKRLDTLPDQVTQQALGKSRDFLLDQARRNASKGGPHGLRVRSGRLLRSIRVAIKPDGKGGATLSLGMVFYGWVHDRGAVIVPKQGGRLRFFIPGLGWRSAMKIVLPERRWARDALDDTRKAFPRYLFAALEKGGPAMNPAQAFIDALAAELEDTFGPLRYTVEVREPVEGELKATNETRQIFITTEGIEFLEGVADLGESTRVNVPIMVACVMKRPSTPLLSQQALARRFTLVQAVQRVCRDFVQTHSEVLVKPMQEAPSLIETYYVSITGVEIEFDLSAEGEV